MARFKTPREFRELATPEEFEALKLAYLGARTNEWDKYADTYGFSRSSALRLLRDANLIKDKQNVAAKEKSKRKVDDSKLKFRDIKLQTTQRTLYIADDTWERLQLLYDEYPSQNKTNIVDAILTEMLDKYLPKKRKGSKPE